MKIKETNYWNHHRHNKIGTQAITLNRYINVTHDPVLTDWFIITRVDRKTHDNVIVARVYRAAGLWYIWHEKEKARTPVRSFTAALSRMEREFGQ